MMTFVLVAALLALVTLALLTRPFWLRSAPWSVAAGVDPVAEARQQLRQLDGLLASGALNAAQHAQAKAVIERRLVEAVHEPTVAVVASRPPSKALIAGLAGFVCVVAAFGYAVLGTPVALDPSALAARAQDGAEDKGAHSINSEQIVAMTEKLAARLQERPDDPDGWAMLGRSYAVLGQHDKAVTAFKQAMSLRANDAVLIADYADALAVVNGRNLEGEPSRLIEQALKVDPNNLKALSLAGTAAFYRRDYALALRHWEKMKQIDPDSQFVQQIQGGIDEARKLAGGPAAATPAPSTAPSARTVANAAASVSGVVTLASAVAGKAAPEDTVFIFARPAEGPRMPLAILRKQVKDLPLTFTLDDSMAMSPAARLSSAQRVVVGARVSKRGDATAQPGDLQGLSAPVAPGARGLKIEIADIVSQ